MPGKAQYNTSFRPTRGRARGTYAGHRPAAHEPAQNSVRFHGPGAGVQRAAGHAGPLPLAASPAVLHTGLECLPIEIVATILWPCMNEIPQTWPIKSFKDFYEALADWNELESQAAEDAHNLLRLQEPGRRVAWANQLGGHTQFTDYRVAGLFAHGSNQFWVRRLGVEWTWPGMLAPEGERQLESLRVAMEIIMLRLFPATLQKHIALLKALDGIEEGAGFAEPQRTQEDALSLEIKGVTFTHPSYPPVARNSIRMQILASAAQVLAERYPLPGAAR
jgi:hypothetical protein